MKSRQPALGDSWVPSRPTPLTRYTLWRCALAPAILRECMYFLAGFLTENREGGEPETSVLGASLSPPHHDRRHLHGRRRAVASTASCGGCLAASPVLRVRVRRTRRRARRSPTFRKHNPRAISTPGGGGGSGTGRRREPGAQISTRILFAHPAPASDGAGRRAD